MPQLTATSASCEIDPAHPVERLPLPHRLGAWQLVRLVAEGALARLYQARPAEAAGNQPACYAVKLLRRRWHDSAETIASMRREAMLGRSVSHPHLISVLAAHMAGPPYYLVMPWLHGVTLAARLAAGQRIPLAIALWLTRQVAEGLHALHVDGWMHADVKPSNVLVSASQHATLLDLGFARQPQESHRAIERPVLGTIHYIAPEMITSVWGADIRGDIYSLGVMLYQLLTGRLPFVGHNLEEIVRAHRQSWPPTLRRLAPHVPKQVARLVHQMLAKDPLRRPQSPRELVERLVAVEIDTLPDRW